MINVAILGFGLEGRSLFSYLSKNKKIKIAILDRNTELKIPKGVTGILGEKYLDNLSQFDVIYRSPGIPYTLPQIQRVKDRVSSLTKLFFQEVKKKKGVRIVGVTGSVGKTTTATLIYKIFKKAGRRVFLAGNIGVNALGHLKVLKSGSIIVMELSSFQLHDLNLSPDIAVVLDIFEEHLDKHKNFAEYLGAKGNIAKYQSKKDSIVYFAENKFSKKIAEKSNGRKVPITEELVNGYGLKLKIPGAHDLKNSVAAFEVAKLLGVREKLARGVIESFKGIEHRIEFVDEVDGVRYFNNSKATNVGSAIGGIDAFSESKIVLCGGYNKNLDLSPLVRRLTEKDVKFAIFFGEAGENLKKISRDIQLSSFKVFKKMHEALLYARKIAKSGDVVLLSPATASFDEFRNYEERGEKFKEWVLELRK